MNERGQGMIEYALILVMVVVVVIFVSVFLGPVISNDFSHIYEIESEREISGRITNMTAIRLGGDVLVSMDVAPPFPCTEKWPDCNKLTVWYGGSEDSIQVSSHCYGTCNFTLTGILEDHGTVWATTYMTTSSARY